MADVLDELTADHHQLLDRLSRLALAREPGERERTISELVRHTVAEEICVYPALERYLADGRQAVDHNLRAHKRLEQLARKLAKTPLDDPGFAAVARELADGLRRHAEDEESDQFPRLRASAPPPVLAELAEKVARAKRRSPLRPRPGAPRAQVFRKITASGVGLLDRIRERVSHTYPSKRKS